MIERRFIIVLGSLELGGSERQALHLAKYLRDEHQGEVEVWGFGDPGLAAAYCDATRIPWRVVPFEWPHRRVHKLRNLASLALALRRARPDVILPYGMWPNVACGLVWRSTGARLCVWNQRDLGLFRMERCAESWAIRQTPLFVSNSRQGATFLAAEFGVNLAKIRIIHNGIELSPPALDRMTWRRKLDLSETCFVGCMVANITTRKDHATLLKAWRRVVDSLRASGQRPVLLLAGAFPESGTALSLKGLVYDLRLCDGVQFLGQVQDVSGLLNVVDLGVFSSKLEGCPNGVLECMAAGLAVVGTDIEGIREAVGPDGLPFLAPPENAELLADQIHRLATNPALRAELSVKNRGRIDREFSLRSMCEATIAWIAQGLEGRLPLGSAGR